MVPRRCCLCHGEGLGVGGGDREGGGEKEKKKEEMMHFVVMHRPLEYTIYNTETHNLYLCMIPVPGIYLRPLLYDSVILYCVCTGMSEGANGQHSRIFSPASTEVWYRGT